MARTKQTANKPSTSNYKRATFKKKKKRQSNGRRGSRGPWWMNDNHSGGNRRYRSSFWDYMDGYDSYDSYEDNMWPYGFDLDVLNALYSSDEDLTQDIDPMGHNDLDDEVFFGKVKGNIVGLQYYTGTVNPNEHVALEREPNNSYDINAIKVKNVGNVQVGHIKRELARPLAYIVDKGLARIEGIVPTGMKNIYSLPVDLHLWGKPEHYKAAIDKLKFHGFYLTGGECQTGQQIQSASQSASQSFSMGYQPPKRTYLTPAEVKNELDKLFETIEEGDKTTCAEPTEAIVTPLYPHQKQALNWMISRETSSTLPPFWQEKNKKYFNSVLNFTTDRRPECVKGGILADDMGLGKTLEMITLIVSHFVDGKPLAYPVPGLVRQTKQDKIAAQKAKLLPTSDSVSTFPRKKVQLKLERVESSSCQKAGEMHPLLEDSITTPSSPMLPRLPEDEDSISLISSSDDSDEEEEEEVVVPVLTESVMTKKEDPDFSPLDKSFKKGPAINNGRPKRNSKRPARYIYSSGEDEIDNEETPKKKGKALSGKGKGAVKGQTVVKGLSKCLQEADKPKKETNTPMEGENTISINPEKASETTKDTSNSVQQTAGKTADAISVMTKSENTKMEHSESGCDLTKQCDTVCKQKQTGSGESKKSSARNNDDTGLAKKDSSYGVTNCSKTSAISVSQEIELEDELPDLDSPVQDVVRSNSIGLGDDLPDLDSSSSDAIGLGDDLPDLDSSSSDAIESVVKISDMKVSVYKAVAVELEKQSDKGKPYWKLMSEDIDMPQEQQKEIAESKKPGLDFLDKIDEQGYTVGKLGVFCKAHGIAETAAAGVFGEYPGKGSMKGKLCKTEPNLTISSKSVDCKPVINYDDDDDTSPSQTVVVTDYSKPSTLEIGASTGRTATAGPRGTLIVCPLSVISNWLGQLEEHIHRNVHLAVYLYYGQSRTKDSKVLEKQDVVVTTYSTIAADFKKSENNALNKVTWLRLVLDEGHMIKNPNALQTKSILKLTAHRKWVLTGTPIQNSMKDLWSLINFLKVNPFTDRHWWTRTIERPLDRGDQSALKKIQHLMSHLSLRRTKTQQVDGRPLVVLPDRKVFIEHIELTTEERAVYEAMQKDGRLIVSKYCSEGTLLHNYSQVLAILMRLRQICCHPFLVAKAAKAVKDTLADIDAAGGVVNDELRQKLIDTLLMVLSTGTDEECAICLDSLKSPVITHCAHVYCRACIEAVIRNEQPNSRCPLCRTGLQQDKLLEVPPEQLQGNQRKDGGNEGETVETWKSSAKVDALMCALLKLRSEDSSIKSIIVSQFTSLLTLLEMPLRTNGFSFVRLDGTMTTKARMEAIREISDPRPGSPTIILLSLKAGGVGINLTAASRVFLMDPAWNPAVEEQCFDRCHRLGQTRDVIITKFIVDDSVETRMLELQERKRRLMQGAFAQKQSAEQKRQGRIQDIKTLLNI